MYIIFDFDHTLTIKHYYHFMRCNVALRNNYMLDMYKDNKNFFEDYKINDNLKNFLLSKKQHITYTKNEFIDYMFGLERIKLIDNLLSYLYTKGVKLIIASRGDKDNIKMCLKYIGFDIYFDNDNIYGNEISKYDLILSLIMDNDILYIDDSHDTHDNIIGINNDDKMIDIYYYEGLVNGKKYYYIHPKYESDGINIKIIQKIKEII